MNIALEYGDHEKNAEYFVHFQAIKTKPQKSQCRNGPRSSMSSQNEFITKNYRQKKRSMNEKTIRINMYFKRESIN